MRSCARILALGIVAALLALAPVDRALGVGPGISVTTTASQSVLVGGGIDYTLTMGNPEDGTAVPQYNIAFRDVLPTGVTYQAGTTRPAVVGEPTVYTDSATGQQTLVWNNVSDLPVGATQELSFTAIPGAAAFPVGATVHNGATGYSEDDARTLVRFDAAGAVVDGTYTSSAESAPASTSISAVTITKTEPSPEHELLRGVHDHSTVYTLSVENNGNRPTDAVTVTDYLPAQLEFLGCGTTDHTPGSALEYPGAPRLDTSTPDLTTQCPTPAAVETVTMSAGNAQGLAPGTYTMVTWTLGDLGAGGTQVLRYRAGVPQRANAPFGAGAPDPATLGQGANLSNNTGPSTRETASEQALTNLATVSGTYQGPVASGSSAAVSDAARLTVTAEDLAVQKSVTPGSFEAGGLATYTMSIEAGEYADTSAIVLTDTLPDGLCPLGPTTNHSPDGAAECDPAPGFAPTGATYSSIVANSDGTYTIVFDPIESVPHDGTWTVSFQARMRATYDATSDPTVSGDSYTNHVSLVGTTTVRDDVDAPEPTGVLTDVTDESSATLVSDAPVLSKTIKPRTSAYDCSLDGTYTDNTSTPQDSPALSFSEGDRVCFRIRVDFSAANATKGPVVTDFLPANVTYEAGSAQPTPANNVPATLDSTTPLTWTIGVDQDGGRFARAGAVFEYTVAGIVTAPGAGPAPDITANLAKLLWTDTGGTVDFLRDEVDFGVAAAPPVAVDKSAVRSGVLVPDGGSVSGGDVLDYSVKVTNGGSAATRNALPVVGPDVWDVLSVGVDCTQISAITDGGVCTGPGDPNHPSFADRTTRSAIRWNLPDSTTIPATGSLSLGYTWTVPATPRVSSSYVNNAAVASYATSDDIGGTQQHRPAANIDTTVGPEDIDTTAASATHTTVTPDVGLTKSATTDITPTSVPASSADAANAPDEAVIGEGITYTVTATVPAHSSVDNGSLSDPMPTGITLLSATADYSDDDGATYGSLPAGASLSVLPGTGPAAAAVLDLGQTYVNTSPSPQRFRVTVLARVGTDAANVHGTARKNTATFSSTVSPTSSTKLPEATASSTVTVVEPAPALTKAADKPKPVVGDTITYTLDASDTAGRPLLHDTYVIDCVPAGLIVGGLTQVPAGTTATVSPGDGSNGCVTDATRIRWQLGDLGSAHRVLAYTATIDTTSAGAQSYLNTATLLGSDLLDGSDSPTSVERSYGATATRTVTVAGASLAKSTSTPTRTIGQRASYSATVTLPANVNFYDAAVIDTLPAGLDASSIVLTGVTCSPDCAVPAVVLTPSGNKIGWSLGDLAAQEVARTVVLTYTAVVADVAGNVRGKVLSNSAFVGWDLTAKADPTGAAATFDTATTPSSAGVTVLEPVLRIDKSASTSKPAPGDTFTYTVALTDTGNSPAYDVTVTDSVPVGVVVDPASLSHGGVLTGAGTAGGGTITWTLVGPVDPSTPLALSYAAALSSPTPDAPLTNTAHVTHYESLPSGGRTYSGTSDSVTVRPALPHVVVAKSVIGGPLAYLGQPKTWQVTVTSDGTVPALGVDVTDTLPTGWTYVTGSARVTVRGGAPEPVEPVVAGQTLSWSDLGDLLATGERVVVTLQAEPGTAVLTSPGVGHSVDQTNTASARAEDANGNRASSDGIAYNGPAATAVARVDSADLRVTKTPTGAAVAGGPAVWTIAVRNLGPDPAVGPITVTDELPGELAGVTAVGSGWSCSGTGTLTCTRSGTVAASTDLPDITVTGQVPAALVPGTELTNQASVSATTHDPDDTNNVTASTVSVTASADLSIDKELTGPLLAGTEATYTLDVTNHGPSVHRGPITVTDEVPGGTSFVSAAGLGWSCAEASGTVTCGRNDVTDVGSLPQITVRVQVDSGRTAAVTNSAGVVGDEDGGTPDGNPTNDTDAVTQVPTTAADLSIDKESVGAFTAGTRDTYRLTVHNDGPSDASGVVVADALPTGLSYVDGSSVTGAWSCAEADGSVTCTLAGTLAPGDEAVVDLRVAIGPDVGGDVANTAVVSSDTPEPAGPGTAANQDTDHTAATIEADLRLGKSHPSGPVVAGEQVSYTLSVVNDGPSRSSGPITVTDALPPGLTCVSVEGSSCSGDAVTYTRATGLAAGAGFTVTVVAHVDPSAGPATLTNRATVSGPEDQDPTNDTATDDTVVVPRAELGVTKTRLGTGPVRAGDEVGFLLRVHNEGPSDATDVVLLETPPAGSTLVGMSGAGWECDSTSRTCTLDRLPAGSDADVTAVLHVDSSVLDGSELINAVDLSSATPGNTPAGDHAESSVPVVARADLGLVKTHVGDAVAAGSDTTYTLQVHDHGPSDAGGPIRVTDTLPAGMSYLSETGPWECASSDGRHVVCDLATGLLAGTDALELAMLVHVDADVDDGTVTNTAHVSGPTTDDVPGNDDATADATIVRHAVLSVTKSHAGTPTIGGQVTFTLGVHNDGPSTARAVLLTDVMPTGLDLVSVDGGPTWSCDAKDATATCAHVGPVGAGQDADPVSVVATVLPAAYPAVTNTAVVTSASAAQVTAEDVVPVPAQVNLALTKRHTSRLAVGHVAHYLLEVRNDGPTDDPGPVTVTDVLPRGLGLVSATGAGWTCDGLGATVSCVRGALATGASAGIELVVDVGPAAYPTVTNTATVVSAAADTDPGDNTDADDAGVTPEVGLALEKSLAYYGSGMATWTLEATSRGPNATVDPVVVVDQLPAGLGYHSVKGPGWACSHARQLVTCTHEGPMAVGASSTVRLVTRVLPGTRGTIRNVAALRGGARVAPATALDDAVLNLSVPTIPAGFFDAAGEDGSLPDTGGPPLWPLPVGAALVLAGVLLLRRRQT